MMNPIRRMLTFVVALGLMAWVAPASADLLLDVDVTKDKNVTVTVDINIEKTLVTNVLLDEVYEGTAEAAAVANVTNHGNVVGACQQSCDNEPNELSYGIELDALINNSVNENQGITGVNQDVGNMVNQANIVAIARTEGGAIQSDAQAEVDQKNTFNRVTQEEVLELPLFSDPDHTATLTNSVNNNTGVVGVNQNSGNNNNQTNALAMALGVGNSLVLSEAALGQENVGNFVEGIETVKVSLIQDSVNGNQGVVQVNQSVGNNNNQGSAIAFGALTTTASVGVPGS